MQIGLTTKQEPTRAAFFGTGDGFDRMTGLIAGKSDTLTAVWLPTFSALTRPAPVVSPG